MSGYTLTEEGKSLIDALAPLSNWAQRWQRRATGMTARR
jgi:DNA-binding HxlR family transcriptional regulator